MRGVILAGGVVTSKTGIVGASAATVQTELNALPNIAVGGGSVFVTKVGPGSLGPGSAGSLDTHVPRGLRPPRREMRLARGRNVD